MAFKYACSSLMTLAVLAGSPVLAQTKPLPPRPLPPSAAPSTTSTAPAYTTSGTADGAKVIVDDGVQAVPSSTAPGRLGVSKTVVTDSTYRMTAAPREPKTGWEMGVFGGANLMQDTDDDPEVAGADAGLGEGVDIVGGLKFGYTWSFDGEPIDQFDDVIESGLRLAGGLEVEAFYVGEELEATSSVVPNGNMVVSADVAVFMANFLLKGQFGKWRLYGGPGVGVSYVYMEDNELDISNGGDGKDDEVFLMWQALGGVNYFINPSWSLFTEYKWLNFEDFKMYTSDSQLDFGRLQNHILTFGVKYHF